MGVCLQVASLRALLEDWEFQETPFLEFVAPALQLLAALLQESTELDTQLQVCCVQASTTLANPERSDVRMPLGASEKLMSVCARCRSFMSSI